MGKYGAIAYSESTASWGYSSQHDTADEARQEALDNVAGKPDDAAVLCCERDCWLAFAQSDSTGEYAWVARDDGPTAAAEAVAECQQSSGAADVELVCCYATDDGEEYEPDSPEERRGKVPLGFILAWGFLSLGALGAGLWMLLTAIDFHANHVEAEGTVVVRSDADPTRPNPRGRGFPYVEFRAAEQTILVRAPRSGGFETSVNFSKGNRVKLWYPVGNPQAAQFEGDRGLYGGGIALTIGGGVFTLFWLLLLVAFFFPDGPVKFLPRENC